MANEYLFSLLFAAQTNQNSKSPSTPVMQQHAGKRKAVAFSTVEIHHHKLILGDHPSVSDGVPLTLDWRVEYTEAIDLDAHEQNRHCRNQPYLCMESSEREQLARNSGASDACLIETRKELSIIQSSRRLSELDQPWGLWNTTSDSSYRCDILLNL